MTRKTDRNLDESWVINDPDEGDISWTEDISSEDDQPISRRQRQPSTVKSKSPRSAKSGITSAGPEFIMPSISSLSPESPSSNFRQRQTSKATPSREQKSRTASARSVPPSAPVPKYRRPQQFDQSSPVPEWVSNFLGGTLHWFLDIILGSLQNIKKPITWLIAAWLILGLLQVSKNLVTNSISAALSPICRFPGISLLSLGICQSPYANGHDSSLPQISSGAHAPEPEFDALMTVQGKFEDILASSATGVSLPLDMKRSETSIRDLRQVVRFSHLPSKNELVHEFDGFVETAREASYDLQKFNSHVGRGVDIVLSTARWTGRVLDEIAARDEQRSGVGRFISDTLLAPFQPVQFSEARLLDQYIQHTHVVSGEIEQLVSEAQALLQVLQNLEDRLEVIHSISLRDNIQAQGSKDEILGQLWTLVGGNRKELGKYNSQLDLLRKVSEYRKIAFAHVAGTVVKLQAMGSELEELRTRVGSAAVLKEAGIKHVPLSVHIENIQLGVERLEIGRQRARELEQKYTRGILSSGEGIVTDRDMKFISAG